jgi:tRNA-splicing ligase RtcB
MPFYPHVDIGCGVVALRTQFVGSDLPPDRKPLREANDRTVPLSAGNANAPDSWQDSPHASARIADLEAGAAAAAFDPDSNAESWRRQLGSLGSLNHFIEVSLDEEERVWLLLHSGSRGVGNKNRRAPHQGGAAAVCAAVHQAARPRPGLPRGDEFSTYIRQLRWAQKFALLNREEMMDRVRD